jgi:Glycosyl transferase 4-like domain
LADGRAAGSLGGMPGPPTDAAGDGPPLSIGLVSPVWPPDAYPSGIVSYVAALAEGLEALGHRTTILTLDPESGDWGGQVHDLGRGVARRGLRRRVADWLWHRAAPRAALESRVGRGLATAIGRAVAERGIDVLEMEEAFGWAGQVRRAIRIPLSVRLHGPWFLVGPAGGEVPGAGRPGGPRHPPGLVRHGAVA